LGSLRPRCFPGHAAISLASRSRSLSNRFHHLLLWGELHSALSLSEPVAPPHAVAARIPDRTLCSYLLGYVCGATALALESRFGMVPPRPFSWLASLSGAVSNGFVLLSWCALYFGVKYYQALEAERHRALLAEASARDAELRALRYQIHPHFLFNTLNAISTLVIEGQSTAAVSMISRLADFFRATLDDTSSNEVSLEDELFLTEQYFEIEKARLGDRLKVNINVDPELLSCLVPHLVLQPLVENAIRHGIAPRRGSGQVTIRAERKDGRARIEVNDDGLGKTARPPAQGNSRGIG